MVSLLMSFLLFVTFTAVLSYGASPLDIDKRVIRPESADATTPEPPAPTTDPTPAADVRQQPPEAPAAPSTAPAAQNAGEVSSAKQASADASDLIYTGNKSRIDATNKDKGYIRISYLNATSKGLKVKIIKMENGKEDGNYVYDLNNKAQYETYPLQMGNGNYTIKVLENVSGNSYAVVQTQSLTVKLSNANAPYTVPTQLINYTSSSKAVSKAAELCKGKSSDLEKVKAIYQYVVQNISYDKQKAADVTAGKLNGYVPNVDTILSSKKGICFDYSSLMGAMLRSQGIPTKLIMGYVAPNNVYHAWNEVYINNVGWVKINSSVYFNGKAYSRMDSTFAAGNTSGSRTDFIANNKNYAKKSEY